LRQNQLSQLRIRVNREFENVTTEKMMSSSNVFRRNKQKEILDQLIQNLKSGKKGPSTNKSGLRNSTFRTKPMITINKPSEQLKTIPEVRSSTNLLTIPTLEITEKGGKSRRSGRNQFLTKATEEVV
jgi:hypothetical protein